MSDTLTRPGYITVIEPTIAGFSAFPRSREAPLLVQFLDNSANADTYLWDFGDPASSSLTSTLPRSVSLLMEFTASK